MNKEDAIFTKCLKSYLTAKKYFDTDVDKSLDYFKQCMTIVNDIKNKKIKIKEEYNDLIDETETECAKYLSKTIEKTLDKPNIYNKDIDKHNLFEIIETGNILLLKKYKYGDIDFKLFNENGLTPLHFAIKFGDISFLKYSFKLGANIDLTNIHGHTLLEYACLEKDPNMINFLFNYGANMKKHLTFREGIKYFNNGEQIDIVLLLKIILDTESNNKLNLDFLYKYINKDDILPLELASQTNSTKSIGKITFETFIDKLGCFINKELTKEAIETFIKIIKEELDFDLVIKLGCPKNKLEILLYNLCPFINYNLLSLDWLLSLEIKYIILKILKNRTKINIVDLKEELKKELYKKYIDTDIIKEGLLQTIILQWFSKIKV